MPSSPLKGFTYTLPLPDCLIGQVPARSSGTGCIGCAFFFSACCWHWAPGFLLSYGTPQQTSKQEENKHGGGRLPNSIAIYNYTRYAPPFSGASIGRRHLGIGCFSAFQFPRVLPRTLIGKRRAHRVRAVHLPGTNKQNRLSLPTHPRTP